MNKVFIIQFDWSTTDAEGIDLYVYGSYDKAYDKFKELICNERNPEISWVGDLEFDDDGYPIDEYYELDFEDNNSCESEVYWHIVDKNDYNRHRLTCQGGFMKHEKELRAILVAVFAINKTVANDNDINKILDYAFRRFFGANSNLLSLACLNKTKEEIMPEVINVLKETEYEKYSEEYK